jgi:perosamine synthetase
MMNEDISLCDPPVGDEEVAAVENVIQSGWLAHGPKNEEFEELFADYIGTDYAISMNSCTSALQLAIECHGITGEVLVPSFTWVASANAIVTAGATPVFVDIDPETRNVDPASLERAVSDETEAIMVVHYGGHPCAMDEIVNIAEEHDLLLIEDSAETIGGKYESQLTGTFGIGCFSLYPTKNITTGEGGLLTTDDEEFAKKVRAYVGHGVKSTTLDREGAEKSWYRAATYEGYNFRMTNMQAAIGVEQMRKIKSLNEKRRENATYLTNRLSAVEGIEPPVERENCKHVYQMYTVMTDGSIDRDTFVEELNHRGIGASVHFYPPVHQQPRYENADIRATDLSNTDYVASNIVTLPMFPGLDEPQLDRIAAAVETVVNEV